MAWNGSGSFVRLFSWVTDALAGTKIRADKMDQEFDNFADGLENCLTRDGQNAATDDIDLNGHTALNLRAPTDSWDAMRTQEAWELQATPWVKLRVLHSTPTQRVPTWLTGTTFRITGDLVTAGYFTPGKELKIVAVALDPPTYHTVLTATFDGTYTQVTHANRGAATTAIAELYYTDEDTINHSAPWRTCVNLVLNTNYSGGSFANLTNLTAEQDILTEVSAGVFTAKLAGYYLITGAVCTQPTNAANYAAVRIVLGGTYVGTPGTCALTNQPNGVATTVGMGASIVKLSAGGTITFQGQVTAASLLATYTLFQISRIM